MSSEPKVAGTDASSQFDSFHSISVLEKYEHLKIGSVQGTQRVETDEDGLMFGEGIPFGDPSWYQAFNSPFYGESHRKLRSFMRSFVDKELMPYCHEWDESGDFVPRSVFQRCGEVGILTAGT